MNAHSPVIVIGMHRSGTSMVTLMLRSLGVFMGARLEENSEALFFRRLNEWLMQQCGAAWDHPGPVDMLLADERVRSLAVGYFRGALRSWLAAEYLGLFRYIRFRTPAALRIPWGWKDPRNTYTLPLWLDLFPNARVVHVLRHGVDVAQSLYVRSNRDLMSVQKLRTSKPKLPALGSFPRSDLTDSVRCLTLEGGFALWEEYADRGNEHLAVLGDKAMEIRYENLVANPVEGIRELAAFCGMAAGEDVIDRCVAQLDAGRTLAYRADPRLIDFAGRHAESLSIFGY